MSRSDHVLGKILRLIETNKEEDNNNNIDTNIEYI